MFPDEYFNYGILRVEGSQQSRVDVYCNRYNYRSICTSGKISRASWCGRSILIEFEGCNYGYLYHDWNSYDWVKL